VVLRRRAGASSELLRLVSISQSRWFGSYVDLLSEHPDRAGIARASCGYGFMCGNRSCCVSESPRLRSAKHARKPPFRLRRASRPKWPIRVGTQIRLGADGSLDGARLGTLLLAIFAVVIFGEGLPPFARQPEVCN